MVERIKVGDKVKVIAGNDSGKEGEISLIKEGRAIVKGLGLLVRHRKKNGEDVDKLDELMGKLKGPLGTRAVRQKATATAARLVELGLLSRGSIKQNKLPPKTVYSSTDRGKRIYEEILSKNS